MQSRAKPPDYYTRGRRIQGHGGRRPERWQPCNQDGSPFGPPIGSRLLAFSHADLLGLPLVFDRLTGFFYDTETRQRIDPR